MRRVIDWPMPSLCAVMAGFLVWLVAMTRHWPPVGDAVSVHYLVLLLEHGMAPYRQIVDAQMPGTYLLDWLVLHLFGGDAAGLRRFDLFLDFAMVAAMCAIGWPGTQTRGTPTEGGPAASVDPAMATGNRCAAFLAAGLFAIVHARDGIEQAGQRDLVMAVLLVASYACAFHAVRRRRTWLLGLAGAFASTAVTIKPTVLPAAYVVLLLALVHLLRKRQRTFGSVAAASFGAAIPMIAVATFLLEEHALPAFYQATLSMWPYYAELQRLSLPYLLLHSVSPVLSLACVWILVLALRVSCTGGFVEPRGNDGDWEQPALSIGLALSLLSFVAQGKGFVYHRYPFLAFLLLACMLEFSTALRFASHRISTGEGPWLRLRATRATAIAGVLLAVFVLAPVSLIKVAHFDWRNDEYYRQLSADLNAAGGDRLSGHVQCLDAFSGCIGTLYRMDLVQSTGFLVDFYFFPLHPAPVTLAMRRQFWDDLQRNPPQVFIVSKQVFPVAYSRTGEPNDSYVQLQNWPLFAAYLAAEYRLVGERTFTRPVMWSSHANHPSGYRIYARR